MATSKNVCMLTHFRNAVPLVWGSLRLAPIMPYLDYCQVLYNPCSRVLSDQLERIQNYAMRLITGKPPHTSSALLRQRLGLTTLKARRQIGTIIEVKQCLVGCAPKYMPNKFLTNAAFGYGRTRGANKLHLRRPLTNFYKHLFEYSGGVLFNSVPIEVSSISSRHALKSALLSISNIFG